MTVLLCYTAFDAIHGTQREGHEFVDIEALTEEHLRRALYDLKIDLALQNHFEASRIILTSVTKMDDQ